MTRRQRQEHWKDSPAEHRVQELADSTLGEDIRASRPCKSKELRLRAQILESNKIEFRAQRVKELATKPEDLKT